MAGEIIRPSALPDRPSPVASEKVPVDNSVTVGGATIEAIVFSGRPTASQAEAEAGTDPTKAMVPLTVKQAIIAQGDARFATIAQGGRADSAVQSVVAGLDISVDPTDPRNPIVSYSGSGVTDGNKGDMVVSGAGSVWTLNRATEPEAEDTDATTASNITVVTPLRTLQAIRASLKEHGTIDPYMTGAVGDGVANDRAAFQAAIDEAEDQFFSGKGGKTVIIPPGNFLLADTLLRTGITAVLHSTGRAHVVGRGRASIVTPGPAVSSTASTLHVRPPDTESAAGFTVANFFMGDNDTGLRQGLHGIFLDTRVAGANFPKPHIHDMYIVQSRSGSDVNFGRAICHQNDQVLNVNGGMYGAVFENNRGLGGGVALLDSGDSNSILTSVISGLNNTAIGYRCAGVDATLCTSDGGAGFLTLEDLNITAEAGAYAIYAGKDINISRVYGEHLSADAGIVIPTGGRALAVINGLGPTIVGGRVSGGRLAAATGTSTLVTTNLYIGNAEGIAAGDGMTLYPGKAAGGFGIELETTSIQNTIARLSYTATAITPANRIVNRGTRNLFNAKYPLTLTADFAATAGEPASVMLDDRGNVHIEGLIEPVTSPGGKIVATIPVGLRPAATIRRSISALNGATSVTCSVFILPDGTINYSGADSTQVSIGCSYRLTNDNIMNG